MAMLRSGTAGRRRSTITFANLINLEAEIPSTPIQRTANLTAGTVEGFTTAYQDENTLPSSSPASVQRESRQSLLPMEPSIFSPPQNENQEAQRLQDEVFDCELRTPDLSDDEETPVKTLLDSPMSFKEKLTQARRQMNDAERVSKSEMGEFLAFVCGPKFAPSASKNVAPPSRPESSCSSFSDMSLDSQYKEGSMEFPYREKEPVVRDEEESEWDWEERQRRLSHHPTSLFRRRPESLSGSMANIAVRCQEQERGIMSKVREIRQRLEWHVSPSSTISPPESALVSPEQTSPTMVCRRLVFEKTPKDSDSASTTLAEVHQRSTPRNPPRRSTSSVSELTPPSERPPFPVPARSVRFNENIVVEKALPQVSPALVRNARGRQSLTLPRSTILKPSQTFNNPQASTALKMSAEESSTKKMLNDLQKPILRPNAAAGGRTISAAAPATRSLRPALVRNSESKDGPGKTWSQPLRASLRFDKSKLTVTSAAPIALKKPSTSTVKVGPPKSPISLAKNVMEFNVATGKYQLSPVVAQSVARLSSPKKLSLTPSPHNKSSPEEIFERSLRQPASTEKVKRQLAFLPRGSIGPNKGTSVQEKLRKALEVAGTDYRKGQTEMLKSDDASSSGVSPDSGFGNSGKDEEDGLLLEF
ncbi:hypothetical protein RvY_04068 [Ramazzottius varieornatus]|uniref:Uncharacterized protein n=1 Tax=Ramazzottius varieornatus TaxID=947166 RepID=A0A1D1UTR2_RAMVA|nr:hypothetical protein RvY_04068 [Ramazzottius varieornatus]